MTQEYKYKQDINGYPRLSVWLRRIAIAGFLAIAIQLIFVYVKFGNLFIVYHITSGIEISFTFLYFLALFWIYPKISHWINSSFFNRLKTTIINITEGVTVVISTFLLTLIVKIAPMWMVMLYFNRQNEGLNMAFDPEALRKSFIIHAVLGLLFYYFVERERLRKEIQAEHIRYAKLQREEFKGQLENLKNQVSPDFLFNSLGTLDTLIDHEPAKALEFVNSLSFVYRSFLDRKEEVAPLAREVEIAEAYTSILKTELKDKFNITLKVDPKYLELHLPSGSLQGIMEQAIIDRKASFNHQLSISICTSGDKLILRIAQKQEQEHPSVKAFLKNIRERYTYLTDQDIEINDNPNELHIELPLLRIKEYNSKIDDDI